MHKRLVNTLLLIALAVGFSGCPATSIALGTWVFIVKESGQDSEVRATVLAAGGQILVPVSQPEVADFVSGGSGWAQNGSTFTMDSPGENLLFTGTVHSSTSMTGTVALDSNPSVPIASWAGVLLP